MAKIVEGAALIGGAIALDVFSLGIMASATSVELAAFDALITSGAVIGGIGAAGASLLLSGIADALHLSDTGQTAVAAHQPFRPWQIVYGRQRVRGTMIDMSLSDGGHGDNRWLWEVDVLAAHSVKGILATYLNQQQVFTNGGTNGLTGNLTGTSITDPENMSVAGMALDIHPTDLNFRRYTNFYWDGRPRFWLAQYDGTQTAADPFYMALCATGGAGTKHWDVTCIVQGMAYSLNRYWSNSHWSAGKPNVRYDVQGKNDIFDPRTGLYGYTENAALVLADYMTNQQYGMMYNYSDFDTATLIAAANICDETVALTNSQIIFNTIHTSEARYTINGTLSTSQAGGSVIEQMLAAMAGRISYVGGKWFIYPGAYQGLSGVALAETDLVNSITWKPNRKARDLFNEVRATFICPSGWDTVYAAGFDVYNTTAQTVENNFNGQWNQIDMPPMCLNALRNYSIDPYLKEDGYVKYIHNAQLPYTISVAAAQRLAKIMLLRNRYQGTGTITLPIKYLGIAPNDIITLTYPRFSWVNKQLEVQSTHIDTGSIDSSGNYTAPSITLQVAEVDASIYTWNAADELKLQGGQSVAGSTRYDLAPPTNLVLESGNVSMSTLAGTLNAKSAILCTWTPTNDAHLANGGRQIIDFQKVGDTLWTNSGNLPGDQTSHLITRVDDGVAYLVQLRSVTPDGYMSDYVQAGPITVSNSTITISAKDTYYSDGKSIASLEPSMAGADITEVMSPVLVSNPGFEAGNTGWFIGAQCAIINSPANAHSGSWCGQYQITGGAASSIRSKTYTPVKPAQVLNGQCMVNASAGTGGYGQVRILFFDANLNNIATVGGSEVAAGTAGYVLSSVIAVAAPGAVYVDIDCGVFNQTGGSYYVDDFQLNFQTTNLDEVPNGIGFARVVTSHVNPYGHPLIDFGDGHTNNNLDYVAAGPSGTYATQKFFLHTTNTPFWFRLGTCTLQFGSAIKLEYVGGAGFNSNATNQSKTEITIRASNNAAVPNLSGISYYTSGGTEAILGVKAVGRSAAATNNEWDIWAYMAQYADGSVSVQTTPGDSFVWNGGGGNDPGPASSTVVIGTGGHVFNAGGVGLDAVNDGASYARLAASQLSGNALDFNIPYANKGALATISKVTNSEMLNGGVFGVGGSSVGSTVYNSATNQDLPLNCLFNAQFFGVAGDQVGAGSNADQQPTLPSGSGLGIWQNFNVPYGAAVWYGQGIVLLPQTSNAGQQVGVSNAVRASWLGNAGDPFVLSVQVAWASTTQPNGDFQIAVEAYGASGHDSAHIVIGSFPASALSSTQFQMAVLEGTLPALSSGYDVGWAVYIVHQSTVGDYLIMQPMLSNGSIVSAWTSQYPLVQRYSEQPPASPPPTGTRPGGGSGSPTPGRGFCPTLDMMLFPGLRVGHAKPGTVLDCVNTKTWERYRHPVVAVEHAHRQCVRLTAANGAELDVTLETPFTLQDGQMRMAVEMLSERVLADAGMDTAAEWLQVVSVESIGEREVCLLSLGGRTFAAGKDERRIYSHNTTKTNY